MLVDTVAEDQRCTKFNIIRLKGVQFFFREEGSYDGWEMHSTLPDLPAEIN